MRIIMHILMASDKRMQPDQATRYAHGVAADAKHYAA